MLSPSHSITRCIDMLKRGDHAAAEALWDSYVHRLVALARARPRLRYSHLILRGPDPADRAQLPLDRLLDAAEPVRYLLVGVAFHLRESDTTEWTYESHNASAAAWSPRLSMSMQRVIE